MKKTEKSQKNQKTEIPEHLRGRIPNRRWKPCSWCHANWEHLVIVDVIDEGDDAAVMCNVCGASGPIAETPQKAVRLWNKGPSIGQTAVC